MDVNSLSPGQRIAAAAGVLLLIDLWLDWYSAGAGGFSVSASAWQAFDWVDILLAATSAVAIGAGAQAMGLLKIPVNLAQILLPLAGIATLIVIYRLINQPGPNDIVSNEFASYLGLVLVAGVAYGASRAGGGSTPTPTAPASTTAPPSAPPPAV